MEFDLKTLNDVFFRAAGRGDQPVMQWRDNAGKWHNITSWQVYQRTRSLANAFAAFGIKKGDRVALVSENRWEWAITDFAVLALGAVDVPLYPTLTAQQMAWMLADSGARIAVVSTAQQYEKIAAIREQTLLEKIVIMDREPSVGLAIWFGDWMPHDSAESSAEAGRDSDFDRRAYDVQPEDLATIIYTSGTTGEPKGVMLTHGNFASNLNYSTETFSWDSSDSHISFLPLSHVMARHMDYALFCYGAVVAHCPYPEILPQAMREVRPTIFAGVPRVYEKIRHEVLRRAGESPTRARLLQWALRQGQKQRAAIMAGKVPRSIAWKLANRLVFRKIHGAFGGRVKHLISGGAPLGIDTATWFIGAGIRILEGYGLTETSPVLTLNNDTAYRIGSVGPALSNVELKLANDGELMARSPSVFSGYWNKPDETASVFAVDGWLLTGDIASIDKDGFVFITDRKKEMLKTSGGKFIAPQPIEGRLKGDVLVANAVVVGDRRKFAAVLISPNFTALESWAHQKGIAATSRTELVAHPAVIAAYQAIVDDANATLAGYETLKRLYVVSEEWSIDGGELTPSMKLKRRIVIERYAQAVELMYADEAVAHR